LSSSLLFDLHIESDDLLNVEVKASKSKGIVAALVVASRVGKKGKLWRINVLEDRRREDEALKIYGVRKVHEANSGTERTGTSIRRKTVIICFVGIDRKII
jgi:hypothetical protein